MKNKPKCLKSKYFVCTKVYISYLVRLKYIFCISESFCSGEEDTQLHPCINSEHLKFQFALQEGGGGNFPQGRKKVKNCIFQEIFVRVSKKSTTI